MQTKNCYCSILFALLFAITFALCEETEYSDSYFNLDEAEDLVNPHSFHYDRVSKKMIKNEDHNANEEIPVTDSPISEEPVKASAPTNVETKQTLCESGCAEERIFYARLIKLLLANLDIKNKDGSPVMATLHLEISSAEMETLHNIKSEEISFREVDAILTKIIQKPSFNFMSEAIHSMENLADIAESLLRKISEHTQVITVCAIVAVGAIMIKRSGSLRHGLPICIVAQLIFLVSFLITWWQLIQDAEIKRRAAQMVYSEIPIACQPDKMNMWHKFVATVFPTNDCEKYYEAMMADAKLKVTPLMALSHLTTSVIVHPMSHIGDAISIFIDKSTDRLPWLYAWVVRLVFFVCIGLVILILPFVLFGASFNIGLGPLFKFGIDCKKDKGRRDSTEQKSLRQDSTEQKSLRREPPVQIIFQMPHANTVPAISTVTASGEIQPLTCLTNTETSKENYEKKAISDKPEITEEDRKSSRESSAEKDTIDTSTSDYCRKRISKIEVGAGDA